MRLFRKEEEELRDAIEELKYRVIELEDENTSLQDQLEMKNEIIHSLRFKQKQLEKRIERMLFELRISDEVLTIVGEERKRRNEESE